MLTVADCFFERGVTKPTLLWTNCQSLIDSWKGGTFQCSATCACHDFRMNDSHEEHLRGLASKVSAAFPKRFAMTIALHINAEAARRLAGK
jgi:hypothetical protein